jgi:ribosomal protein S18 acetylase RimI-like enzyme
MEDGLSPADRAVATRLIDAINEHNLEVTGIRDFRELLIAENDHELALGTHTFQAPAFYRRHGFEVVGELDGHPTGHAQLLLRKGL